MKFDLGTDLYRRPESAEDVKNIYTADFLLYSGIGMVWCVAMGWVSGPGLARIAVIWLPIVLFLMSLIFLWKKRRRIWPEKYKWWKDRYFLAFVYSDIGYFFFPLVLKTVWNLCMGFFVE